MSLFGWHPFEGSAVQVCVGVLALAANLIVAVLVTLVVRRMWMPDGPATTRPRRRPR